MPENSGLADGMFFDRASLIQLYNNQLVATVTVY